MKRRASRRHFAAQPRKGVALVLSLILIVVLSATAAAALAMVGSERRVVEDHSAAAEAHAMARSAAAQFIANPQGSLPSFTPVTFTGPDSTKFVFSDGYAWVSVQRIRPSVNQSAILFLIRSRAVRTENKRSNTPVAERVFAQYAQWLTGKMPVLAAWTSLTSLQKNGGSGTITGADQCGQAPNVAGIALPTTPGYVQNGGTYVPVGTPPLNDMGSQADANAMINIDWQGIVGGASVTPDIILPAGAWPSFTDPNYWPLIYVDQAAAWSLPASGRGMLIVRNNMIIAGNLDWDGIILVGGSLSSSGNNHVKGAVVTGLNMTLGEPVSPSDLGSGNKTYAYDSCKVAFAAARFTGLAPLRNTAADNWQSY